MRKLKLQVQISIDGFVAGPEGEMDWLTWNWDDKLIQYVNNLSNSIDCIVLGRKLAEGFIPHWLNVANDPANAENEVGKLFSNTPKFVFSKSLKENHWHNATLLNGDLVTEINKLKNQSGKDMMAYGGASFVSSLIKNDLIDEYHLFVNPAAIGKGLSIFGTIEKNKSLVLINSMVSDCGIVVMHYQAKRNN